MKKKNKLILISGVLVILLLAIGVTFAMFTYTRTGTNQQLVLGDIWMKYTETNGISLQDVMPGDDYSNYFEFQITGLNTYTKEDIWYDIVLTRGDVPTDKTEENRVADKYLKFKLVEVNDGTETILFTDKTYDNLTNKRVYVSTIPANTTTEYNKTYRLYMTLSEKLTIGNTDNVNYTMEEYENIFGSVKVSVTGDFTEKEVEAEATDASCFEYGFYNYENPTVNPIMATQEVMEVNELTACTSYEFGLIFDEGSTAETFCKGTGTAEGGYTFQETLDDYWHSEDSLQEMVSSNIIVQDGENYVVNSVMQTQTVEKVNELTACTSYKFGLTFDEGSTAETFCKGTGTVDGKTFQTTIDEGTIDISELLGMNVITATSAELYLNSYDTSCGSDVVIPSTINGLFVTIIAHSAFNNKQLTSVVIPNSVITIGNSAFSDNQIQTLTFEGNSSLEEIGSTAFANNLLTTLKIPNSVTTIGGIPDDAYGWYTEANTFANNQLTSIEIGNGIQRIDPNVFSGNENLVSLKIDRTCSNIKNIVGVAVYSGSREETSFYPWGANNSGATIYGTDGEVCDTFE